MRYGLLSLTLLLCAPALASAQGGEQASQAPASSGQSSPEQATPEQATEAAPHRESTESEEGQPRYLAAMQRELSAMRVRGATCESMDGERGSCSFSARGITTGHDFNVKVVYSDRTDVIYVYIENYLTASADAPATPALLQRLMALNWTLLVGKFEWDPTDGEIRLAMTLNTDSNFDRRAFRSVIRGIGQLADRYHAELLRLSEAAE